MIKIALKHWIYEKCIDVLFKAIGNNFCPSHKQNLFRPGDTFLSITFKGIEVGQTIKISYCTILVNEGGTVLIKFYGSEVIGGDLEYLGGQSFNPPTTLRIKIASIIKYDYRIPA